MHLVDWPLASLGEFFVHHWAALAIALTVGCLLAFAAAVLAKYVRISLNIFTDAPPLSMLNPMDYERIVGETVRFRSFDGSSLRGMWLRPRGAGRGTIVFCHEFGADMFSCARYVRPLLEAGFTIFTFDFRGHGESSRPGRYRPLQWPSDRELEDVLGATAYVGDRLAEQGQPTGLGIFGISRGAGAAILAAASDGNIRAIACDGAFSTETVIESFMKRWAYIFARIKLVYENHPPAFWMLLRWLLIRTAQPKMGCRYPSVRRALRQMAARPILMIHGQRDSYISEEHTELLYAVAPPPRYKWIVPGARHNQSVVVAGEAYARRTTAFFRRYLAGEAIAESVITGADQADPGQAGSEVA